MLKAVVVYPNERTPDMRSILEIARAVARKVEHTDLNISVVNIIFDPVTRIYVAIYEWSQ